jgi:hypothetical protein
MYSHKWMNHVVIKFKRAGFMNFQFNCLLPKLIYFIVLFIKLKERESLF